MSVLLYHNGVISADSRCIISQNTDFERNAGMLKLFGHNDYMVMGMIGDNVSIKYASQEYVYFSAAIKDMESNREMVAKLPRDILKVYTREEDGRNLCFMTKRHLYIITKEGLERIITDTPFAMGTGARIALMSLTNGCTVEESVRNAIQMNPYCGGTVVTYSTKDLSLIRLRKKK
ncbi:hypothetical protein TOTORO_00740 [Serratia phage vB_SmaS-Totoro]|nr:hypothetical protein TOTORO_00740 [Serratia phage vB_SmaS-Totoro]